ncbi:MAG: alkaline phosphatase family protein [Candidatus Bathyarchaeota archaeon]|nr:alkaline phosphatase family protein [Candidatus Bathyarchaeota archaeon]
MKRAAMIGLDGMSWHILDQLFEWKVMPNLEELTKESLRGTLRSTIPPESAPAWTSIATGVNPGKHGIFSFTKPTENYDDIRIMSSRDVKYLRIHEMVAIQNLTSVCVNQLLTYPIKRIQKSYVITDWLSPEIKYSPEIKQYAENYRGPTLSKPLPLLTKNWHSEYVDVSSRVDTVNTLLQKINWDLFWVVYSEPDHLFHRYYDLVMKRDKRLMQLFTKIDETFGIVKDIADLIIVVSDHGFRKYSKGVYVNTTLGNLGLAEKVSQQTIKNISCQRQIGEPKVKFRLPEKLNRYISAIPPPVEAILLKLYKQFLKADIKVALTTHVNPKSSKAFAHGFGIFVKEKKLIDYVISMLKKKTFVGGIWKKEELYDGEQLKAMPDLVIVPNFDGGFAFRGDVIAPKSVIRRGFSNHHPDGIIILYEKNVRPVWVNGTRVYDVVPTILDFLGLDIPENTDGKVINFAA